jgi:ribosome-associated protein
LFKHHRHPIITTLPVPTFCRGPSHSSPTQESTIPIKTRTDLSSSPEALKKFMAKSLDDDKAEDIEIIDLNNHSALADYMIIATGTSSRHVSAMAEKVVQKLSEQGIKDIRTEGTRNGDWVIVDAGDVIVHLFRPEVRAFYNLEKMWRSPQLFDVALVSA